jgi:hypothetical protein
MTGGATFMSVYLFLVLLPTTLWSYHLLHAPVIHNGSEYRSKLSIAAFTPIYLFTLLPPNFAALLPFADYCDLHLLVPSTITSLGMT